MDNLQFNNENQNSVKPDNKKIITYAVIGVAAVVAVIIVVSIFSSIFGGSYKTPIKKAVALVNKKVENDLDYAKYSSLESYYEYLELSEELLDEDDDEYEEYLDELAEEYGDNFKVKFKISDVEKADKDDLKDFQKEYEELYEEIGDLADDTLDYLEEYWDEEDLSSKEQKKLKKAFEKYVDECEKLKITAAYEVELECTIKGSEDDDDFELEDIIIAKVNGEWVFLSGAITPKTIYYSVMD